MRRASFFLCLSLLLWSPTLLARHQYKPDREYVLPAPKVVGGWKLPAGSRVRETDMLGGNGRLRFVRYDVDLGAAATLWGLPLAAGPLILYRQYSEKDEPTLAGGTLSREVTLRGVTLAAGTDVLVRCRHPACPDTAGEPAGLWFGVLARAQTIAGVDLPEHASVGWDKKGRLRFASGAPLRALENVRDCMVVEAPDCSSDVELPPPAPGSPYTSPRQTRAFRVGAYELKAATFQDGAPYELWPAGPTQVGGLVCTPRHIGDDVLRLFRDGRVENCFNAHGTFAGIAVPPGSVVMDYAGALGIRIDVNENVVDVPIPTPRRSRQRAASATAPATTAAAPAATMPCTGNVLLHWSDRMTICKLARPIDWNGLPLAAESAAFDERSGGLSTATLRQPVVYRGWPIAAGEIKFYIEGPLERFTLGEPKQIDGVTVPPGTHLELDPRGRVESKALEEEDPPPVE